MPVNWTPELDAEFAAMRAARTDVRVMAARFGTTVGAVYAHARAIGALVMTRRDWTPDCVESLKALDEARTPVREMARRLGRTEQSVAWKLKEVGSTTRRLERWDDALLLELVDGGLADADVATRLGRTEASVARRLRKLRPAERRLPWEAAEEETLAAGRGTTVAGMAVILGREPAQVRAKARAMGVALAPSVRTLDEAERAGLAAALRVKGGLLSFAATLDVDPRWLRDRARELGHDVQRRRRRALDDAGKAEIVAAAQGGMTVTAAIKALGRDLRTLKAVAAEAGVEFARVEREPKAAPVPKPRFAIRLARFDRAEGADLAPSARARPAPRPAMAATRAPSATASAAVAPARPAAPVAARPAGTSPAGVAANKLATARRKAAPAPVFDRAGVDDAVARFLAARAVTRETIDPVEATVRAIRRRGYTVVRDGEGFLIDGRTRVAGDHGLALFARDRRIDVPGIPAASGG